MTTMIEDLRNFVRERMDAMSMRPHMWASTRESFGMQLLVMAEIMCHKVPANPSGVATTAKLMSQIFNDGDVLTTEPLDAAWATHAVRCTKNFLEGHRADVVVRCAPGRTDDSLVHLASIEEDNYYIWCRGNDVKQAWTMCPEGDGPSCMICVLNGPPARWFRDPETGIGMRLSR